MSSQTRSSRIRRASSELDYPPAKRRCLETATLRPHLIKSVLKMVLNSKHRLPSEHRRLDTLIPYALASRPAFVHLQWHLSHATFIESQTLQFNGAEWFIPKWLLESFFLRSVVFYTPKLFWPFPSWFIDVLARRSDSVEIVVYEPASPVEFDRLLTVLQVPPRLECKKLSELMVQVLNRFPNLPDVMVEHFDDIPLPALQKLTVVTNLFVDLLSNLSPITTDLDLDVEYNYYDGNGLDDLYEVLGSQKIKTATIQLFIDMNDMNFDRSEDYIFGILRKVLDSIKKSPIENLWFTFVTDATWFGYGIAEQTLVSNAGFEKVKGEGFGWYYRKTEKGKKRVFELGLTYDDVNCL
uniref:F-box domain-containing protein n=1 Tax=Panagrellus redivivus TaxID=6233 RepID=A0A7E5A1K0_PANRE